MLKIVEWLGTATSIAGSYCVAFGYMTPGYGLFLTGAACWIYSALRGRNWAQLTMQGFFLIANIIGFVRAIFGGFNA